MIDHGNDYCYKEGRDRTRGDSDLVMTITTIVMIIIITTMTKMKKVIR